MNVANPAIDLAHLRQWVGRERSVEDSLSPFPARALAAALDGAEAPGPGDALPPAWQWLYFLETPRAAATGTDGHPTLGGFLPPVPLPRRMWASGSFNMISSLTLGEPAIRKTAIRSVETKSGGTGLLVFVTEHELSQQGRLCIWEQQNLVYREMPATPAPPPRGETAASHAEFSRLCDPNPVLLFRYSALTYNGHRIHYDRPYATAQERYPGLIVQGPLLATLLLDLMGNQLPDAHLASYRFRAMRPTFDIAPFSLCGTREGGTVALWTTDHEGELGMPVTAKLA